MTWKMKLADERFEGREEGDLQRAKDVAANLLLAGDPIEKISEILHFPIETIRSWGIGAEQK